jgi:hypothetical protein
VALGESCDERGLQKGVVAGQHDHVLAAGQLLARLHDGVASPGGRILDRHLDVVGQRCSDLLGLVAEHDDDALGACLAGGEDGPEQHRAAAQRVQDLRQPRAHARAPARRHDQNSRGSH